MKKENYHELFTSNTYVDIYLPLALQKTYTYYVPEELINDIKVGCRVEVQFGKTRLYAGLIAKIHNTVPSYTPKPILTIIDKHPVVKEINLSFWKWIAEYYSCTVGDVMVAALPANLKLASETKVRLSPVFSHDFTGLSDSEYLIVEALTIQEELTLKKIKKILNKKTIYKQINDLLEKRIIYVEEELHSKYKPKKIECVRLQEPYKSHADLLEEAFELTSRSSRQTDALLAFVQLVSKIKEVRRKDIYEKANVDINVLKALVKKGIFEFYEKEISRIEKYNEELLNSGELTNQQIDALEKIKDIFKKKNVALLHGVTGSGKTRVYIELINDVIKKGGQVLYLLPEIALTTQIISRLRKIFGNNIAAYHHRINPNERVEIWKTVLAGKSIILSARSGLLLPFQNLKLIIIDEEHDSSFKQYKPAPRYHARDAAIYLGTLTGAKIIMGTATPSIESYYNSHPVGAKPSKFGLVEMPERYGGIQMPELFIVDIKKEQKKQKDPSLFTPELIEELKNTLKNGEQAILFQNRRGYSPTLRCNKCGWHSECNNCDVSLTYHMFFNNLQCHYCGFTTEVTKTCPACGNDDLKLKGFGTEKIEDELKIFLPEANISRMDYDTVKSKDAYAKIISDFEERRIDILVGTQMVTKGFDFDNVRLVGILSADQLLQFPDFRSGERGFQLITQVSGRAGRKNKRGKVIIQTANPAHPVIQETLINDFQGFYAREIMERKAFGYPPFVKLIKITLKHTKPQVLNNGTRIFAHELKKKLGDRVIGPAIPYVSRVRGFYLLDILIKLELKLPVLKAAKNIIRNAENMMHKSKGFSTVRVIVDVDPV